MKKLMLTLTALSLLSGCADPLNVGANEYPAYGIVNENENKNAAICYEVPVLNIIYTVIFIETIIVPVYIVGWNLNEPIGTKNPDGSCKRLKEIKG